MKPAPRPGSTPLLEQILAEIDAQGPISIARYMDLCLNDPAQGYYAAHPRLGAEGDFVTAPHISQMFGELLGLWSAQVWRDLGSPGTLTLAEMGPGDGTMMSDVRRALRAIPDFAAASRLVLIETSSPLRAAQQALLGEGPRWVGGLDQLVTSTPLILLANELLDCLPIRQGIAAGGGAAERRVGRAPGGRLGFVSGGSVLLPQGAGSWHSKQEGLVFEWSEAAAALGRQVARLVTACRGAALFIDYAREDDRWGDTLQAIKDHQRCDPLQTPGCADLTAHADFPSFADAAREAGAQVSPIVGQGAFLRSLGVEMRADRLARAHPEKADTILRQLRRLISADGMGTLFKVICVHSRCVSPPGFESVAG